MVEPVKDLQIKCKQLFINNEFVNSVSGKTFDTVNPATLDVTATIQESDKEDVDIAVRAAKKAFELGSEWRRKDASERGLLLLKLADLIERDIAILATLDCLDVGKPFMFAVADIQGACRILRHIAGFADKMTGKTPPVDGDFFTYTRLEPVGVVGAILPWNFPTPLLANKMAAALAAGCTMVIKPAEQTPLSALHVAALVKEVGFPPGVVNIVPGYGPTAGHAIAHHMDVDKVTFTGSTEVGRLIMKASGESNLKKVTLELGGKSPVIVFADADLDYAVEMSHFALFFNMGQCCTAGSRTFVQESIYDEFVGKATKRAERVKVGDPFDLTMEAGPQIDNNQLGKIVELIDSGKTEGARLMCGGGKLEGKGYFVRPTVFADVKDEMRIAREEIFGPVQQIIKFNTLDEVVPRANRTPFGLAASVFTRDVEKALRVANGVRAGTVWVNCHHVIGPQAPFGGYKQSGIGREFSEEGVREYCEVKTVTIKVPEKNS